MTKAFVGIGIESILLFFLFSFTFLLSPYYRSKFDYGRSAVLKLIFTTALFLSLSFVLVSILKSCGLNELISFVNGLIPFVDVVILEFWPDHKIDDARSQLIRTTFIFAFSCRLGYFGLRYLYDSLYFARIDFREFRTRNNSYKLALKLNNERVDYPYPAIHLGDEHIDLIKSLRDNKAPFQWVDLVLSGIPNSNHQQTRELLSDMAFSAIMALWAISAKRSDRSIRRLIVRWIEKLYRIIKSPLFRQRFPILKKLAWENSEDMLHLLYDSLVPSSTLVEYHANHPAGFPFVDEERRARFLKDVNNQISMVSIHTEHNRIHTGWVVNTAKAGDTGAYITILPFKTETWHRDSGVLQLNSCYKGVLFKPLQKRFKKLVSIFTEGSFAMHKDYVNKGMLTGEDVEDALSLMKQYKSWLDEVVSRRLLRSNGKDFEASELLRMYPATAEQFYKAIRLSDVRLIHPYSSEFKAKNFK